MKSESVAILTNQLILIEVVKVHVLSLVCYVVQDSFSF